MTGVRCGPGCGSQPWGAVGGASLALLPLPPALQPGTGNPELGFDSHSLACG